MLHVTNGRCAADLIREAGLPGTVLAWDDVLHEGPVPAGLDTGALAGVRAAFLASCDAGEVEAIRGSLMARDATLAAADEVVLWFEHDLYDQLQLIQVLAQLPPRAQVTTVLASDYLGHQAPATLAAWFTRRAPLEDQQVRLAVEAWDAFRAADPGPLAALAARLGGDGPLPHLGAALRRHLRQFPSTRDGLSRTESQALTLLADARRPRGELFRRVNALEDPMFMGDLTFFTHVETLAAGPSPLIEATEAGYALTGTGARVLAGEADRVAETGIDRWLGGVHVCGPGPVWRWDEARATLVRQ
ncbi:MAG: DUF1835 domain-containing protein [Vicinamibacterales bacterium]